MIKIKLNDRVRDSFLQIKQQAIQAQMEAKRLENILQTSAMSIAMNSDDFNEGMNISLSAECSFLIMEENKEDGKVQNTSLAKEGGEK